MFRIRDVKGSWISRFLDRNHLSRRTFTAAHPSERNCDSVYELISFLNDVRRLNLSADRIVNIDPTSVYSDARYVKQAGAKGRYGVSSVQYFSLIPEASALAVLYLVEELQIRTSLQFAPMASVSSFIAPPIRLCLASWRIPRGSSFMSFHEQELNPRGPW